MNDLMIDLQGHHDVPLYEQIYRYIRQQIVDGEVSPGEKLPSTRLLSKHLQVSRSTVELSYEQLRSEGFLVSKPYRGYYTCDISELYVEEIQQHSTKEIESIFQQKEVQKKLEIQFTPDRNEMEQFPYSVWRKLSREMITIEEQDLFEAGDCAGEFPLRAAISRYLYHARGVKSTPDQIIVGAGNEYLLILLSQVLGGNKRVGMENPTYRQAYLTFLNMGYEVIQVKNDENGMLIKDVTKKDPDIVYTMPSHQFPLGTIMPVQRRLLLLQWAMEKSDRYLIEDDHDSEFRYKGKPIPALQGYDRGGKVIYMGTFSKSIAASLRVSYMILPQDLMEKYKQNCGFYSSTVPRLQQMILSRFLSEGYFERHLNRMRGIYKSKHDYLIALLKKKDWIRSIYGENAGMHLIIEVETDILEVNLLAQLKELGVIIYSLNEFLIPSDENKDFDHFYLLGYGSLKEEQMKEGVQLMERLIQQQKKEA